MVKAYLRDLRNDALALLKEHGHWIIAGVDTNLPWPKQTQLVPYDGLDFILRPMTEEDAATVCLNAGRAGLNQAEARDRILRFGSALSWSEGGSFEVTIWLGASLPVRIGRRRGGVLQEFMDAEYLPDIPDEDAATALAFYREGLSSNSNFYAFLSLYKVIAFIYRDGKRRGEWFDKALPALTEPGAVTRITELVADHLNPSEYLRDSGRHAIAHAEQDVYVNPDKLMDHSRIYKDLPIMRALARMAIQERFDIFPRLSRSAPERSNILGFERLFGPELIERLLSKQKIEDGKLMLPDNITALVRFNHEIVSFAALIPDEISRWHDGVNLRLVNHEKTLWIGVGIDFRNHKLLYEPQGGAGVVLNKSSRASVTLYTTFQEFNWLYVGNGRMELWDPDTDELCGMTEAYLPINSFYNFKAIEKARANLQFMLHQASEP